MLFAWVIANSSVWLLETREWSSSYTSYLFCEARLINDKFTKTMKQLTVTACREKREDLLEQMDKSWLIALITLFVLLGEPFKVRQKPWTLPERCHSIILCFADWLCIQKTQIGCKWDLIGISCEWLCVCLLSECLLGGFFFYSLLHSAHLYGD